MPSPRQKMKILGILLAVTISLQTGCASDRLAGGMRLDIHDLAAGGKLVKSIPSGRFAEIVLPCQRAFKIDPLTSIEN
jgi:hypothetical protein